MRIREKKVPLLWVIVAGGISVALLAAGAAMLGVAIHEKNAHSHHPMGPPAGVYGSSSSRPTISGVCDLSSRFASPLFLVDVAVPSLTTLDEKLSHVRSFLSSIPSLTNLGDAWGNAKLGIAVYYGNEAYLLESQFCSSLICWQNVVSKLTPELNPQGITVHNATRGMQFMSEEFGRVYGQLEYGVGRDLILIGDGFEFSYVSGAVYYAKNLRENLFDISSIAITQSDAVANAFLAFASTPYNFYRLNYANDLDLKTVQYLTASWICRAVSYTTPGVTPFPSKPTLPAEGGTSLDPYKQRVSPCQQYIDLIIAFHTSTQAGWDTLTEFLSKELIATLIGDLPTSPTSPYNLALMSYTDNKVTQITNFSDYLNVDGYSTALKSVAFVAPIGSQMLSLVYRLANSVFGNGREYASRVVVVFADFIDPADAESAKRTHNQLPLSYVLAVQIATENETLNLASEQILNVYRYANLSLSNSASSRYYGNVIASTACRFVPSTSAKPTRAPSTIPPPTERPPAVEPREVWPDIAILIDVSADTGDREFEAIRYFLQRTLLGYYSITQTTTQVAVALFSDEVYVKATFNDIVSYTSLQEALGPQLQYGEVSHSSIRDLAKALTVLNSNVYNETYGFVPSNENFLWIFLTGSLSDSSFVTPLVQLQRKGVRTEAISLGDAVSDEHLSQFSYTSFHISNWLDDNTGINSPSNDLSRDVFEDTTRRRTQPWSEITADFYFVIDESNGVSEGDFMQMVTFVKSLTSRLTVNEVKSAVSILPFSSDVNNGLHLSSDEKEVENYLNGLKYSNPQNAESRLDKTVQTLATTFAVNNNRSSHFIFLLGSPRTTGAASVQTTLSPLGNVFAIGTNYAVSYLGDVAGTGYRFNLSDATKLQNWIEDIQGQANRNEMTVFFETLAQVQEEYMQTHPLPLNELSADFVFAIDITLISNQTFPIIKKYILDLGKKLNIGPDGSQVAAHCYTNMNSVKDGFHFSNVKSYADLEEKVNGLTLESNDVTLPSDIAGAFVQIADYFLIPENGWREGPTYTIVLSTATSLIDDADYTAEAQRKMFAKSRTLGLNMDGQNTTNMGFLREFVRDYYNVVDNVTDLALNADFSLAMLDKLDRLYKNHNFPEPPEFVDIIADFVFIIDHSTTLTADGFSKVKSLLLSMLTEGTFDPLKSRLGVISYSSAGRISSSSFDLNAFLNTTGGSTTKSAIEAAIQNLQYIADSKDSDLSGAMQYVVNSAADMGLRDDVPAVITLFAASPRISTPISEYLTSSMNARRLSYAFQASDPNDPSFDYINSFLGSQRDSNMQRTRDFTFNEQYRQFIVTAYQRWQTTFGYGR